MLLLVRGGGSIEDLWQFNEEALARAIRASDIPVVAGVGHETDFTIADFAADERAPTPTAAAELVSPPRDAILARVAENAVRLSRETARRIDYAMQTVDALARRLVHPAERLRNSRQHLVHLAARLAAATAQHLNEFRRRMDIVRAQLESLGHDAVLARGYSLTVNLNGEIVRDDAQVDEGERIVTTLAKGKLESQVKRRLAAGRGAVAPGAANLIGSSRLADACHVLLLRWDPIALAKTRIHSFGRSPDAVSSAACRASLAEAQQYYAHPHNGFWPIMGELLRLRPVRALRGSACRR